MKIEIVPGIEVWIGGSLYSVETNGKDGVLLTSLNGCCLYCGAPFRVKRGNKKYCGEKCLRRAYRERRRNRVIRGEPVGCNR